MDSLSSLRGCRVSIVEVGPRDGLQNESTPFTTDEKVAFIDALSAAGLTAIEVSAFVNPKRVPQMADAAEVFERISKRPQTTYTALVPNLAGLERAAAAGLQEIAIFAAASDAFSRANINQSIEESLSTYSAVCAEATRLGMRVRAYLSTAFGCPYEGAVPADRVAALSARLRDMGAGQIALSDTIGVAHPAQVDAVLDVVTTRVATAHLALHLHDTRGTALANVLVGLMKGVRTFDASAGGLGGCPYAPGASGNLATEDLLYMLDGLGVETGVSLDGVVRASRMLEARLAHALPSRYLSACRTSPQRAGTS